MGSQGDGSSDGEELRWTLEAHLREGAQAVLAIEQRLEGPSPQPVCHHFSEVTPIDVVTESRIKAYSKLEPMFVAAQVNFASDRLEAWESVIPSADWLAARIPAMHRIAEASALIYEGWTWEPKSGQPVGACTFYVINNRAV